MRVAAGLCILLALTVLPLELLPTASTVLMPAIAAFGLALLVRDGLPTVIVATMLAGVGVAVEQGMMGGHLKS